MATWVPMNAHSNQSHAQNFSQMNSICKSQRIKQRQLRGKKKCKARKPGPPLWFKVDAEDERVLILKNGSRLRQPIIGVSLYITPGGAIYSLTRYGLRKRHVNYWKKNTYGKRTSGGTTQGQNYPYITFRHKTYRMHIMMALAWKGGLPKGHVPDHINGNIDDFRTANLRVITVEENDRCGGILRRLRNASVKYNLPELNPRHMTREELLERFERYKDIPGRLITQSIRMEAEFILSQK